MCLKHQREVIEIITSAPEYFYYALEMSGWRCPLSAIRPRVERNENIKALGCERAAEVQFPPGPAWPERLAHGTLPGHVPGHSPQTPLSGQLVCSWELLVPGTNLIYSASSVDFFFFFNLLKSAT